MLTRRMALGGLTAILSANVLQTPGGLPPRRTMWSAPTPSGAAS